MGDIAIGGLKAQALAMRQEGMAQCSTTPATIAEEVDSQIANLERLLAAKRELRELLDKVPDIERILTLMRGY